MIFFFFLTGIRAGSWRTRDITIDGKNPTDLNFVHIGNQVVSIDTVKYFQQSLETLADTMTDEERPVVRRESRKFVLRDENLAKKIQPLHMGRPGVGFRLPFFGGKGQFLTK